VAASSPHAHLLCDIDATEEAMNIATLAGWAGPLCVALLISACQQTSSTGSSQTFVYQQKATEGQAAWETRHCCRRSGRNGRN
jgi:hypothetical protein